MKHLRSKLTYANVMATIAVFIALGGASYAAVALPKNSVGTKQIVKEAVTAAKIKNGAVTGSKIALSSLGTVPSAATSTRAGIADNAAHATTADSAARATTAESATHADSATTASTANKAGDAQTLAGLSPAQIAAASKLTCPAQTVGAAGLCFETTQRTATVFETAARECSLAGRFLPSEGEMRAFFASQPFIAGEEWVGQDWFDGTAFRAITMSWTQLFNAPKISEPHTYRCVVLPGN
jgi:hypothetical protein